MNQLNVSTQNHTLHTHLEKEFGQHRLQYDLLLTQNGYQLIINYGNEQFIGEWFPPNMEPIDFVTMLFRESVTPCTANDIIDDFSYRIISEKLFTKSSNNGTI